MPNDIREDDPDLLAAAMLIRSGLEPTHPDPVLNMMLQDVRARAEAWADEATPVRICRLACERDGVETSRHEADVVRKALSAVTASTVFSTVVGSAIAQGYAESRDTTRGWVRESSAVSFRTEERTRLRVLPRFDQLERGGTAKLAELDGDSEFYRIARYANQFTVGEQEILDGNSNVFTLLPRMMGQAALRVKLDLAYVVLLANANLADGTPLFDSDHGNDDTGAALADATLASAVRSMAVRQQNDIDIGVSATTLIVPPTLRRTARKLVREEQLGDGDDLAVVAESRLENGVLDPQTDVFHEGSASTWYLADSRNPDVEIGYLSGSDRPVTRMHELQQGEYGLGWDVKFDVGATPLGYHGVHRAAA